MKRLLYLLFLLAYPAMAQSTRVEPGRDPIKSITYPAPITSAEQIACAATSGPCLIGITPVVVFVQNVNRGFLNVCNEGLFVCWFSFGATSTPSYQYHDFSLKPASSSSTPDGACGSGPQSVVADARQLNAACAATSSIAAFAGSVR